jgi:glucan 1,3-beta-glucosidase
MRFSTFTFALAAAEAVSAAGNFGYSLGAKKADGTCKFTQDYEDDFAVLASQTKLVRIYSVGDCNTAEQILPAAKAKGFQVILGLWLVFDPHFSCAPVPDLY